jgi:hypothetical protein
MGGLRILIGAVPTRALPDQGRWPRASAGDTVRRPQSSFKSKITTVAMHISNALGRVSGGATAAMNDSMHGSVVVDTYGQVFCERD